MKAVIIEIIFKEDLTEEKAKESISNFCENDSSIKTAHRLTHKQLKKIFNPVHKKLNW